MLKSLLLLYIYTTHLFAESVVNNFDLFSPPSPIGPIEKLYGKGREAKSPNEEVIQREYVVHGSTLWIQLKEGRVIDFYANLPSFLSHDIFHQFLIRRYGAQGRYFKKNRSAIYQWDDKEGRRITYSGQCTLTCFPHYLSITPRKRPEGMNFREEGTISCLPRDFIKSLLQF